MTISNQPTAGFIAPPTLIDDYRPAPGVFDEMRAADGSLRPHWQYLLEALRGLGPGEIDSRRREARRLIRDNGVTYNIQGDPRGMSRPWELDPLPLLIQGQEWAELERGLIQRAELLNLMLVDLYGERELVRRGLIPIELIHGHAGYLLPCHGVEFSGNKPLVLFAADLTRTAEGRWQVIADRTQSPSGAGYALENRIVLSRVLPSLFRDSHVHRLANFYRGVRRAMNRLAPNQEDLARIALMTPGPSHAAHFEHSYLANYLGFLLVQGSDLSVRDGALWLRTLGRLERIDGLLRRVDDVWCDTLELREDSLLGVPGLLAAVRAGNVVVANALGSGVLEHPGLMARLPKLCQHLLGEELLLPQVRTWWCGDAEDCAYVLANLQQLVIRSLDDLYGAGHVFGHALSAAERETLMATIRAQPTRFVAQEDVKPSTAPAYLDSRIAPRPFVLRSFLVGEEDGYAVMPGGLGRLARDPETPIVSNQLGGLGKDTWVLASEPERQETLSIGSDRTVPAQLQDSEVSSRVADNLFWIGRYAERAEGLVRLLRVTILKVSDRFNFTDDQEADCLRSLLRALAHQSQAVIDESQVWLDDPAPELLALTTDSDRLGGLPQTLQALIQAAWSVRERLSNDTWRIVNDIEKRLRRLTRFAPQALGGALDVLDPLITSLVAFSGLTQENMTHNEGWHFLESGRRLERGANLARLMRATLVVVTSEQEENLTIEAVLGVTDSLMTYRRRYQGGTRVGALLDLVLQDETNPRSLAYQVVRLQHLLAQMPQCGLGPQRSQGQKIIMRLLTDLRLAEIDQLASAGANGSRREALEQRLITIEAALASLSNALTAQYFHHEERPHHLIEPRQGITQ